MNKGTDSKAITAEGASQGAFLNAKLRSSNEELGLKKVYSLPFLCEKSCQLLFFWL